jgi:hypothetical protein
MSKLKETPSEAPTRYTGWLNGRRIRGTAEDVLARIQRQAKPDSSLRKLAVEEYATSLIDNAAYFFPNGRVPHILASHDFPTSFDKALEYLDAMPSSGIQILSRAPAK